MLKARRISVKTFKFQADFLQVCKYVHTYSFLFNECPMSATTGLRQAERGGWRHSITSSRAQKQDGGSKYSLFSTFMRFDSMKATLSLCSVYSWRRSSLAASIFRGFLEA